MKVFNTQMTGFFSGIALISVLISLGSSTAEAKLFGRKEKQVENNELRAELESRLETEKTKSYRSEALKNLLANKDLSRAHLEVIYQGLLNSSAQLQQEIKEQEKRIDSLGYQIRKYGSANRDGRDADIAISAARLFKKKREIKIEELKVLAEVLGKSLSSEFLVEFIPSSAQPNSEPVGEVEVFTISLDPAVSTVTKKASPLKCEEETNCGTLNGRDEVPAVVVGAH